MNTLASKPATPMSEPEFRAQIKAICEAHNVREFCLYGRNTQVADTTDQLLPPDRLIWLEGETQVAEEAEYHFGRMAVGKEP